MAFQLLQKMLRVASTLELEATKSSTERLQHKDEKEKALGDGTIWANNFSRRNLPTTKM